MQDLLGSWITIASTDLNKKTSNANIILSKYMRFKSRADKPHIEQIICVSARSNQCQPHLAGMKEICLAFPLGQVQSGAKSIKWHEDSLKKEQIGLTGRENPSCLLQHGHADVPSWLGGHSS